MKWTHNGFGLFLACLLLFGYKQQSNFIPNNNNGGYTLEASSSSVNDSIFVMGTIKGLDDGTDLPNVSLQYYCEQVIADVNGNFQFKESKAGLDHLILYFRYVGYKPVETKILPLRDTLKLEILMDIDHGIILHCDD